MQIYDIQERQDNEMIAALPYYFKDEETSQIDNLVGKRTTQRFSVLLLLSRILGIQQNCLMSHLSILLN